MVSTCKTATDGAEHERVHGRAENTGRERNGTVLGCGPTRGKQTTFSPATRAAMQLARSLAGILLARRMAFRRQYLQLTQLPGRRGTLNPAGTVGAGRRRQTILPLAVQTTTTPARTPGGATVRVTGGGGIAHSAEGPDCGSNTQRGWRLEFQVAMGRASAAGMGTNHTALIQRGS
jgi:hypothetical protein